MIIASCSESMNMEGEKKLKGIPHGYISERVRAGVFISDKGKNK